MTNIEIGNRIKHARNLRNATLDNIAQKVGVTKSTIQRYETGKINTIKIPVVESIAAALNVNPLWILGKSDIMELPSQKVPKIMMYYNQLNNLGKREAVKRVEELTYIPQYTEESDFLLLNAAHADDYANAPEELKRLEEDIMDDENF